MDLDPASWGGLELGLKIGPVKTSNCDPVPSLDTVHVDDFILARVWDVYFKQRFCDRLQGCCE